MTSSQRRRHWWRGSSGDSDAARLSLPVPLVSAEAVVRQLEASDATQLAEAAQQVSVVRGQLALPATVEAARDMLSEFADLRRKDAANLFGVATAVEPQLVAVVSIRLDEPGGFVGEIACWGRDDEVLRRIAMEGLGMVRAFAHARVGLRRIWVDLAPLDPISNYLAATGGWSQEASADEPGKVRFSSIG